MTTTGESRTHEFKAEIKQLLDILIHSIYTSKDVFVRELISNAADALEKVRFKQAAGEDVFGKDQALAIRIETNKDERLLVISDSGIGMTEEEVETNIGTIAHSGATAFLEQLKKGSGDSEGKDADINLIGRFGVGFYSVFMAAEKVVLTSRSANQDSQAIVWTSDGAGSYTVETIEGNDIPRGTTIEIHLKEDDENFADEAEIKSVITRYSNFVPFPILVNEQRVNQTTALWREPARQITDEQYTEFYKLISHDYQDPMMRLHHSLDGALQYNALLFVPQSSPELMGFGEGEVSLQLYVQRVLIDGSNKDCLPNYLRFVKGVVESQDIPLNVSRETLQQNRVIHKIRDNLTRKLLDRFLDLAKNDPDEYKTFWKNFQRFLKEGYSDFANREKIQELYRFTTSRAADDDEIIGLADYVEHMPEGQSAIYYLSGPTREALDRDPRLELFRKNKVEVLYLYDAADEFVLSALGKYKEKDLVSAEHAKPGDLKFADSGSDSTEDKPEETSEKSEVQPVIDRFKEILGDRVIDVRVSERLVDSPACLVGDDNQLSSHMEKMMRMMNKSEELPQRVLEINANHALIQRLAKTIAANANGPFVETACEHLFEGCMLLDGYLTDPHELVARMNQVLTDAAGAKADG
ncbi:MAG: molecular chaperone HtpG [Planctomycetales bacterium]|nr:molecular chaperone HtpG [Planctomycetales bacterium]